MGIFDVLGGRHQSRRGMSPIALAVLGVLAYRTMKGKGRLADIRRLPSQTASSPLFVTREDVVL